MTHPFLHPHRTPFLIQRVLRRVHPRDTAKGVDRSFSMDYMGSAEFEWGALPAALDIMRDHLAELDIHKEHFDMGLGTPRQTYWVVSTKEMRAQAVDYFVDLVQNPHGKKFHVKEHTYIARAYGNDPHWKDVATDGMKDLVGWWAIDAVVPWVIFRAKSDAEEWLRLLQAGKT